MDIHANHDLPEGNKSLTGKSPKAPVIQLTRLHHRGIDHIALRFEYNISIKAHLQQLVFLRWTKTHRCFYIANAWKEVRALINHCRGKIWVDITLLGKKNERDNSSNREDYPTPGRQKNGEGQPIKSEIRARIEDVQHYMEQKRYGASTVKTYLSFIRHFFSRHPSLSWDGITRDIITTYNRQYFIKENRSYSTQNQWINAIKVFCMYTVSIWATRQILRGQKRYNHFRMS